MGHRLTQPCPGRRMPTPQLPCPPACLSHACRQPLHLAGRALQMRAEGGSQRVQTIKCAAAIAAAAGGKGGRANGPRPAMPACRRAASGQHGVLRRRGRRRGVDGRAVPLVSGGGLLWPPVRHLRERGVWQGRGGRWVWRRRRQPMCAMYDAECAVVSLKMSAAGRHMRQHAYVL